MSAFIADQDTWKGQRYKVHYLNPGSGEDRLLKVELSSRSELRPEDIAIVDGIRTYKIPALFDQKMSAGDGRTQARDLFDLGFLAEAHGDSFSTEQVPRADRFSRDIEALADRFRPAFEDDELLRAIATADDRALVLRIAVIEQMHRRGQAVVEQSVPRTRPLEEVLARHRIWLESNGREGCRADLRGRNFGGAVLLGVNLEKADARNADFTDADLRNANLRGTDLRGTDIRGANVTGFSFRRGTLGPTTKGFAEALVQESSHRQTPYMSSRRVPRRIEPERDVGPSR